MTYGAMGNRAVALLFAMGLAGCSAAKTKKSPDVPGDDAGVEIKLDRPPIDRPPAVEGPAAMPDAAMADTSADRLADMAPTPARMDRPPMPDLTPVMGERYFVYAGGNRGIDLLYLDPRNGQLTHKNWWGNDAAIGFNNANYITIDSNNRFLYTTSGASGLVASRVFAWSIDQATGNLTMLNSQDTLGGDLAYFGIAVSGTNKYGMASNWSGHNLAMFRIMADGSLSALIQGLATFANPHQMLADSTGRVVFVPCMGSNVIAQFRLDGATGRLTENGHVSLLPDRPGPRHMAFSLNGQIVYLLNELNQTISAYRVNVPMARLDVPALQMGLSSLPPTAVVDPAAMPPLRARAAAIFVHQSGKFLYTSTRMDGSVPGSMPARGRNGWIGVYAISPTDGKLTSVQFEETVIEPRGMGLDPTGKFLLVASVSQPEARMGEPPETGHNLVTYSIDPATGRLTRASGIRIPQRTDIVAVLRLM